MEQRRFKFRLILFGSLLVALGTGFGFKGYALLALIPLLFALRMRIRAASAILATVVALIMTLFVTAVAERLSIADSVTFVGARLTEVQVLGTHLALDNLELIGKYTPVVDEVSFAIKRISGDRSVASLQATLFELLHGENPLHMQVSLPSVLEYYAGLRTGGVLLWLAIFALMMSGCRNAMKARTASVRAIGGLALFLLLDAAANGLLVFRIADLAASLVVTCVPLLIAAILLSSTWPVAAQRSGRVTR